MKEFWDFVANFRSVTSWVAKAAVAMPLADMLLGIGPGWPARPGIGTVTAVAEIVMLMWAFQFWRGIARKRRESRMRGSLCFLVPLAIVYLMLLTFCTYPHPQLGRQAKGIVLKDWAHDLLEPKEITLDVPPPPQQVGDSLTEIAPKYETSDDLLRETPDASEFYKQWSIDLMRLILLVVWIGFFVSLAAFIGGFVLLQPAGTATQ
jgi:hypothetical protein